MNLNPIARMVNTLNVNGSHNKEIEINLNEFWTYPSLQAGHVIYVGSDLDDTKVQVILRTPYTLAMEQAGVRYDGLLHHKPHETSPLLDALLSRFRRPNGERVTYVWVTIEARGRLARKTAATWAKHRLAEGLTIGGTRYRVLYGQFIDDGKLLLVPADSGIKTLADIGIHLSDDPKGAKRFRRDTARHQLMLEFEITDRKEVEKGTVFTLRHAALNLEIEYLDFDMSQMTDEKIRVVDGMHVQNLFDGHVKFTGIVANTAKGFGHPNDRVKYGVVAYGPKDELILNGTKAYLGVMDELHMHDAYMDIQTFVNMGFYDDDLCPTEARYWMDTISSTMFSEDEDAIRDLFAVFAHIRVDDTDEPTFRRPEDKWASVRADELMIESKSMPVRFRRAFQTVFEHSIDLTRGRIPMMRHFQRLDVAPNPLMFLADGDIDFDLDELGDDVCAWTLPEGPILMGRNPNAHRGEAILVRNRHLPTLKPYALKENRTCGLVFFGRAAGTHLAKLNGGDMDDTVWATGSPQYIAKWRSFVFPVTEKIAPLPKVVGAHNPYLAAQRAKYHPATGAWNMHILHTDLDRWTQFDIGLGTFINRIMLDTLLSGENRLAAIESLERQAQTDDVRAALEFLRTKEDFILRREASNSDLVIDWLQMRKGDKETVDALLNHSAAVLKTPVFPMCYAERVPLDRKKAGDYLLVETRACRALNALALVREQIIETARQTEWMLVRGIPTPLDDQFPAWDFVRERAHIVRSTWRRLWDDLRIEYGGHALPDEAYTWLAHGYTDRNGQKRPGLIQTYLFMDDGNAVDRETRLSTAVEIYRQIYSKSTEPVRGDDGMTRSFGDGVPDFILHDFMSACEQAGITGHVVYVDLDPRARCRLAKTGPIPVRATHGHVIDTTNGLVVGVCDELPNGAYTMSAMGVIVVRASHPELQSTFQVTRIAKQVAGELEVLGQNADDDFAFAL